MKKRMVSVWAKRALALALSFALVTPVTMTSLNSVVTEAYEYSIEVPTPVMEVGFEKGFKGETEKNGFAVVESEPILNYYCVESHRDDGGTNYDFDFTLPLYTGVGADAAYKKGPSANTPSSEYDEVMGHVIWMQDECTVSEFIKTEPAYYTSVNATTGETVVMETENAVLDAAVPPYTPEYENGVETEASLAAKKKATLQEEYTYYPEAKMNNPFAESELTETPGTDETTGAPVWSKGVTVNYWVKLTADADDAAKSENTVVINFQKKDSLQYARHDVSEALPPENTDSTLPYGYADGCLQISADGSVIFTEDDGTSVDQNSKSETSGQVVKFNSDNMFSIAGSDKVLTDICKPAEWHMVTVNITNDSVKMYYDGQLFEEEAAVTNGAAFNLGYGIGGTQTPSEDMLNANLSKGTSLLDWLAGAGTYVSIGGCNEAITKECGGDATVSPFALDDLRFYDQLLTTEQIAELYNEGTAKMAAAADENAAVPEGTILSFKTTDDFSTDIKTNTATRNDKVELPTLVNDTRMGSVLKTFAGKTTETSAAKVSTNPFAGKELSGATISYWMMSDSAEEATVGVSFIDGKKKMYHSKMQEDTKDTEAFSILYAKTDGFAGFQEGTSDTKVPETLKNQYTCALPEDQVETFMSDNANEWHLYTMTVTNKEIVYYVDGVRLDNASIDRGPRFFDGYYQRVQDAKDNNVIYGGSGNSGATALLTFLTYSDTEMYVAYANTPKSGSTYQVCTDAYFGDIICHDVMLTDAQVAKLYEEQLAKYPEVTFTPGDVNNDGKINATDALAILQHSARIKVLEGDALLAADMTSDSKVDATDALKVLQKAAGIL